MRASGANSTLARMYDERIAVQNMQLRTRWGPFRARIYRPFTTQPRPAIVVVHGVHYLGIDEPRLVPFATNLARAGVVVLTPELRALTDYRVDPSSVDEIIEAARFLAQSGMAERERVGVFGLSFAGGLALVAAAEPRSHGYIDRVAVMGAHHDLQKVLRFLATDTVETPGGVRHLRAHDYGLVLFVYMYAERFVDRSEVALFRDCLRWQLHMEGDRARHGAQRLSPRAQALIERILTGDKTAVRDRVVEILQEEAEQRRLRSLSPVGRARALHGKQIVLLHGAEDNVVPPTEAEDGERELRGQADVTLLLTKAIGHVGIERTPTFSDQWKLVHAFARLFGG
jgi:acetyl esterase/lipase